MLRIAELIPPEGLAARLVERIARTGLDPPAAMRVVGLCGPQGSGKSTLALALQSRLEAMGLRTAVLSLDDLYLGRAERRRLAAEVHPLLAVRGPPGTHDTALGLRTLDALSRRERVPLPRFDKGSDDRSAEPAPFDGPADVTIFEGWCVGARPQNPEALIAPVNALESERDPDSIWRRWVNAALAADYQALFARLDLLVLLEAPDFDAVVRWRQEQERALEASIRRTGAPGAAMSDAQVATFTQHFERLTRHIACEAPARADVRVVLDGRRRASIARI